MRYFLLICIFISQSCFVGCDFTLPQLEVNQLDLSRYQVFGIQASSPWVRPNSKLTLTLHDFHPYLQDLTYQWKVCLVLEGSDENGLKCINESLEIKLDEITPRITLDLGMNGIQLKEKLDLYLRTQYQAYLENIDQEENKTGGEMEIGGMEIGGMDRENMDLNETGGVEGGEINSEESSTLDFTEFVQQRFPQLDLDKGVTLYVIAQSGAIQDGLTTTFKRIRVLDLDGELPLAYNPQIRKWSMYETQIEYPFALCEAQYPTLNQETNLKLRETVLKETTSYKDCTFHERAVLNVQVQSTPSAYVSVFENQSSDGKKIIELRSQSTAHQDLEYGWYLVGQHARPPFTKGYAIGQFPLVNRIGPTELIMTVRDRQGGFAIARHQFTLVINQNVADQN